MAAVAVVGSFFCPVVGTAVGSGVGLVTGIIWDKTMDHYYVKQNLTNTLRKDLFE
jgi:uncharacterized membrane protein